LKFWQMPPGGPGATLATPARGLAVTAVALSADGNQLVSGSADKTVRVSTFGQRGAGNALPQRDRAARGQNALAICARNAALHRPAGTRRQPAAFCGNAADRQTPVSQKHGPWRSREPLLPSTRRGLSFLTAGGRWPAQAVGDAVATVAWPLTHPDAVTATALTADGKRLFHRIGGLRFLRSWNVGTPPGAGGAPSANSPATPRRSRPWAIRPRTPSSSLPVGADRHHPFLETRANGQQNGG